MGYVDWATKYQLESILSYINIKAEYKKSCETLLGRVFVQHSKSASLDEIVPFLCLDAVVISQEGTVYTNKKEVTIGVDSLDGVLFLKKQESEIKDKIRVVSEKINKQKLEENNLSDQIKKIG